MEGPLQQFKAIFPPNTNIINVHGTLNEFEASLRCPCKNKEEFLSWLKEYEDLSKITFRVLVTRPRTGKTVLYKAVYRCQHNTYPNSHQRVKNPHAKHTGCTALLRVTIKSSVANRRVRSDDKLRSDFPTLITVIHKHNHNIVAPESLKFRDISEEAKAKLLDMFKSHHSPSKALENLKEDLIEEYEQDYSKIAPDSSLCPNIRKVYSVFQQESGGDKFSAKEYLEDIIKNNSQANVSETQWSDLHDRIGNLMQQWKNGPNAVPFYQGLQKTVHFLENTETNFSAISALHSFGRQFKGKKYATAIPVQATSVTIRKPACGEGKCVESGRSLKNFHSDHSYTKRKE